MLTYVKGSKLEEAQIPWLNKLSLFDFAIKYRTGKLSQAAVPLSHHPKTDNDNPSNNKSEYHML